MTPPERLVSTPPLPKVTPPETLPALVTVPLSITVPLVVPVSVHAAPLSTITVPNLVKLVPRPVKPVPTPVSVPVPPDASSSTLLALVLPATVPLNTAPGSTTTRSFAVPTNLIAVPPVPVMVPAFVTVPPETRETPMAPVIDAEAALVTDRKSTRLNSSHQIISYAVFCLKKKKKRTRQTYMGSQTHV